MNTGGAFQLYLGLLIVYCKLRAPAPLLSLLFLSCPSSRMLHISPILVLENKSCKESLLLFLFFRELPEYTISVNVNCSRIHSSVVMLFLLKWEHEWLGNAPPVC